MTLGHPFADLSRFPTTSPDEPRAWRIVQRSHAENPMHYSASGNGRFDLNQYGTAGTCYLAETLLGALLETVWRDVSPTGDPEVLPPIAPTELNNLVATQVPMSERWRCADVSGKSPDLQLHTSFGITEQIGMCDDYERPQQWAGAWAAHEIDGVHHRLSHGTAQFGWAIFGPLGPNSLITAEDVHDLDEALLTEARVPTPSVPHIDDLDVIDDPEEALPLIP